MVKYITEFKNRSMNLPAWVLVVDSTVLGANYVIANRVAMIPVEGQCESNIVYQYFVFFSYLFIFPVFLLIIGILSDIKIGRERTVHSSLWLCWMATIFYVIICCINLHVYSKCHFYWLSGALSLVACLGIPGLLTNVLPYGLNQVCDKSKTHSRAFIHWAVWGFFFGNLVSYSITLTRDSIDHEVMTVAAFVVFIINSIALCLHSWFSHKFENSGIVMANPYIMVYKVLKYACFNKSAQNRSALTYWESEMPSRIDLGKEKYGGPFKEIQVEDTKTLGRIITVFFGIFGFFIVYYNILIDGSKLYIDSFKGATTNLNGHGEFLLRTVSSDIVVLLVPVFELVIIPLFPKIEYFLLKPLRGFGAAYVLLTVSVVSMLTIDTIGDLTTTSEHNETCLFEDNIFNNQVDLSYLVFIIPVVLSSLAGGLGYIFIFEFICCQTPNNMVGMIIGIFWSLVIFYRNIGRSLLLPFFNNPYSNVTGKLSCSFYSLVTQSLICVFGLLLYFMASRRYKQRQREDCYDANMRTEIENYFLRNFQRSDERYGTVSIEIIENQN